MRALGIAVVLLCSLALLGQAPGPAPAPAPVEVPVTPELFAELQRLLADGIRRFESMDEAGVLAYVSERYQSGPLTKPLVRQQLRAMFATNDALRARVQIREVRMIGDRLWVSSTGDVTGRVRFLGTPVTLFVWTDGWDVAWRENGQWRLIGDRG
jgi:hypothetical protein